MKREAILKQGSSSNKPNTVLQLNTINAKYFFKFE